MTHRIYSETFLNACNQYPQFLHCRSFSVDAISSDAVSTSSETSETAYEASTFSQRRASVDTALSSVGSSDSRLQNTSSNASSAGAVILRKACRYDCYCKCHTQGAATNRGFSRLTGSNAQCTDRSCQAAASSNEPAVAPSRFFRRALSQVMSSKSIKVRYDLNTFRMVSEGSDAMRYVKHGNLDKLKMCMGRGEATLWDTAPDGWSLLHVSVNRIIMR